MLRPSLIVPAIAACLFPCTVHAATSVPTTTPQQVQAAERLEDKLVGASRNEPRLCEDKFQVTKEMAGGASAGGGFDISPAAVEVRNLEPDTTYAYCVAVHNRAERTATFELSTQDVVGAPDPDDQTQIIDQPTALGSWMLPVTDQIELQAGERAYVPYVIVTPASIPRGTLAARMAATRLPAEAADTAPATIRLTSAQRIYLTMPSGDQEPLEVSQVRAPWLIVDDGTPRRYRARMVVRNAGSELDIYDAQLRVQGLGRGVARISNGDSAILPGAGQRVTLVWEDLPWIGLFRPKVVIDGQAGNREVSLPWLLILPSWPWLVLLAAAVLLPLFVALRRWRQSRAEWRQYLEEEDDEDWDDGDDWHSETR